MGLPSHQKGQLRTFLLKKVAVKFSLFMPHRRIGEVEVWLLHSFPITALVGSARSTAYTSRCTSTQRATSAQWIWGLVSPKPMWVFQRGEISCTTGRYQTLAHPANSPLMHNNDYPNLLPHSCLIYTKNLSFTGRLTSLLILTFKHPGRRHCPITKNLLVGAAENAVWLGAGMSI
jgi:hypothetical protein